jgi:hypothetical protein
MKIFTPEEFSQKYGADQMNMVDKVSSYAQQPPKEPGLFQRIGQDIQGAGEEVRNAATDTSGSVLKNATGMVAAGFNAIPKVASEFLPEIARKGLNKVGEGFDSAINFLGEKLGNVPAVHNFVINHPEAAKTLVDSLQTVKNVGDTAWDTLVAEDIAGGAKKGINGIKNVATKASEGASNLAAAGTEAVSGLGGKFSTLAEKPIPAQVQSALKGTSAATFDEYANTAKAATESFKNPTPLEMAGEKAQGALNDIQGQVDQIGKLKRGSIETFGDKPVGTSAKKFVQGLEREIKSGNLIEGDSKMARNMIEKAKALGNNPSAKAVDEFIDYAQDELYSGKRNLSVPVTDSTTGMLRKYIGQLNDDLKSQLPEAYGKLNDMYSEKIGVRNELNSKLGAEGEKGGSLMKRVFSPSDAGTKKLFSKVQELTGVDLVNEATMARFMMETFGDARQVSMLEKLQLPNLSERGILTLAKDLIAKHLNTPEKILKRARQLTNQ